MAVQKMQLVVQKNTSQTINQLVILRTADERNRTAGSSSHRPLGFGSRAAFVCHRTAAGEALAISIPGRRHSALPRAYALRAVCAGRSVRNIHRAQGVFSDGVLPAVRVPETPPGHLPLHATHSGGVLVGEPTRFNRARADD